MGVKHNVVPQTKEIGVPKKRKGDVVFTKKNYRSEKCWVSSLVYIEVEIRVKRHRERLSRNCEL